MNRFEMMHYYDLYTRASTQAHKALEGFENMKDLYDKGYVDAEAVTAAEEEYLTAKSEAKRLWKLSEYGPQPERDARWKPRRGMDS